MQVVWCLNESSDSSDAPQLLESDAFLKREGHKLREGFPALPTRLTSTRRVPLGTGRYGVRKGVEIKESTEL